MKTITHLALVAAAAAGFAGNAFADSLVTKASFKGNEIRLYEKPLAYEIVSGGKTVVPKTEIGIELDGKNLKDAQHRGLSKGSAVPGTLKEKTPVYKKGSLGHGGVESTPSYAGADFGDFEVRLVARADGVAWRFEVKKAATIGFENASLTVPAGARCWFNRTGAKSWGNEETVPEFADADRLPNDSGSIFYLPFVYSVDGKTVAVTETDLHSYPIWNFGKVEKTDAGMKLSAAMEKFPKTTERVGGWGGEKGLKTGGRWVRIKDHEEYLVKTDGPCALPWRTFVIADAPSKLCEADIVYALATPPKGDFSWVKPGKVAWDWWNAFDNGAGCNTKTYERFIDFAAKNGVEYVIFDEGWSESLNIWKYSREVDVPHLIDYANKKGVGIILWMAWAQVYGEEAKVAEHFSKLGAKGFKVDFMDRGDAEVATFLEKFAAECAKHKMLVDYHGAYRPVGLNRKYPNVINYEGIHGLEQMKWAPANKDMPMNDVACFFLRLTAGPMDYTPGAMLNKPYGKYSSGDGGRYPGSVGTRCHQMAMMSLYEGYLQMLCDSPTNYEKNEECFKFMAKVPTVWDDTVGLGGCPETYAAAARKAKDGSWYASGLCNKEPREVSFDTAFLKDGEWNAELFRDAQDCATEPTHYVHETKSVKAGEKMTVWMAPGGGFTVRFSRR